MKDLYEKMDKDQAAEWFLKWLKERGVLDTKRK